MGISRQWAEQRMATCIKEAAELENYVKRNQREARWLLILGVTCFFLSLLFQHPKDYVMSITGWVFIMVHFVWEARGAVKGNQYKGLKIEADMLRIALQLAYAIAHEEQLLEGSVNGPASVRGRK